MLAIWPELEEKADLAKEEVRAAGEHAQWLAEMDIDLDELYLDSLRTRMARAFFALGARLDPEAAEERSGAGKGS